MKKILFFIICLNCFASLQAQNRYEKWTFSIGLNRTEVQKWRKLDWTKPFEFKVLHFPHKNWGIGFSLYASSHLGLSRMFYRVSSEPFDPYSYVVPRYVALRSFYFLELPIVYRLSCKRHTLLVGVGLSNRSDLKTESEKLLEAYHESNEIVYEHDWGYRASLTYQFRVYRNFGLSADMVFRQSKDIPNTLSYGLGLTYSIFNKKREKETKQ